MKRIRVLLFTDMRWITGGNKRTWELMNRAKSHGIDYVSVIDGSSLNWYKKHNIQIPRFDYVLSFAGWAAKSKVGYLLTYFRAASQISRIAQSEKVDLIYSPSEFPNLERIARLASIFSGIPWTVLMQLVPVVGIPQNLNFGNRLRLRLYILVAANSVLLTPSSVIAKFIRKLKANLKVECIVPGIGVDLALISSIRATTESFDAIFFARLAPEKGSDELIPIWKKVLESKPTARLAVCGIPTENTLVTLKERIAKEGLDARVLLFGFQEENSLISLVKSSTLVLYPSHFDSYSMVVLESLACGKPVVAYSIDAIESNYAGCPAVVTVKENNVDNMARRVTDLLSHPESVDLLSSAAREFSRKFDWKYVVEAEKKAYLKVIQAAE